MAKLAFSLGSARDSRAGFGDSPKRTLQLARKAIDPRIPQIPQIGMGIGDSTGLTSQVSESRREFVGDDCIRSIARAKAPHVCVTAQTLPQENASTRVLRKPGFVLKGSIIDPEEGTVWEWSDEKQREVDFRFYLLFRPTCHSENLILFAPAFVKIPTTRSSTSSMKIAELGDRLILSLHTVPRSPQAPQITKTGNMTSLPEFAH